MEKIGRDITCFWKDLPTDPWTEIYSCTVPQGMFGKEVAVGFTVSGFNGANPAQFLFSEIHMKAVNLPTIVIIR